MTKYWEQQMDHAPTEHYYAALTRMVDVLKKDGHWKGRVLEIGTGWGISGSVFVEAGANLVTIDPNMNTPYVRLSKAEIMTKVQQGQSVEFICATSDMLSEQFFVERNIVPWFPEIFIDGRHDYESVKKDIETARELLSKGGVMIFDDYTHPKNGGAYGVAQAVDEYVAELRAKWESVHTYIDKTGNGLIAIIHK